MTFNWRNVKLGDIADVTKLAGFEFTKYIKYDNTGEIIALRALNIRNGTLDLSEIKKIKKEVSNSLLRSKLYANDILLTYTGNGYGDCAIITENDKFHLAPNVCKLTPKLEFVNPYYLYTYIRSRFFYNQMSNYIGGSGQPTIPMKTIRILKIPIVDLETQQKIAKVLSAIDDKIELNNSINNNLEQQAQAIFKSWFVDFEPFGGTMPNGWSISNLSTTADYLNGLAMQKFRPSEDEIGIPVLKIKELRQGFCDVQSDLCSPNIKSEYIINDGDVIFSWSGTLCLDIWCGGLCGLNQHLFKVFSENYDKWFYYFWTKYHLNKFIAIAADKATTMGHIKREDLDKSDVIIPDEKTYIQLNSILTPMLELMVKNRVENRHLTQLRDTLLPKLMSGEIDVSNVDISTKNLLYRKDI